MERSITDLYIIQCETSTFFRPLFDQNMNSGNTKDSGKITSENLRSDQSKDITITVNDNFRRFMINWLLV